MVLSLYHKKEIMKITQAILDKLTEEAKVSPRLRINMDLRDSSEDGSQRMLNAICQKSANCCAKNQPTVASKISQLSRQNTANWHIYCQKIVEFKFYFVSLHPK